MSGTGDDSIGDPAVWRSLVETEEGRRLVDAVQAELPTDGLPTPSLIGRWRRHAEAAPVATAIDLVRARRASGWKFRDVTDPVMDRSGGEQATPWMLGAHKAVRLADAGTSVLDLCCGAGADAAELVRAGLEVEAVDRDPVRAWMTAHNARCRTTDADVTTVPADGRVLHLDPARRTEHTEGMRRRLWRLEDLQPPWSQITRLTDRASASAVKLGPGVDARALLQHDGASQVEFLSLDGTLTQAVWWRGVAEVRAPVRAAGIAPNGRTLFVVEGDPAEPVAPTAPVDAMLWTVDPAVERAGLLGTLADTLELATVHHALGLLTGPIRDSPASVHPALTAFRVEAEMPFRRDRVAQWLAANDAGLVEVKTRAKACDPDVEQAALRGTGQRPFVVFVLRIDRAVRAIIATRVQAPA